jgi:hypothetical protein
MFTGHECAVGPLSARVLCGQPLHFFGRKEAVGHDSLIIVARHYGSGHSSGLPGVTQVATSGRSVLAVDSPAERLWAWGDNSCGDLGDGTTKDTYSPELIGLTGVSQVMQGWEGDGESSAAIRWDGSLWTWGCNRSGMLATGTTADAAKPALAATLTNVTQFASGTDLGEGYFGYSLAVGTLLGTVPSLIGDTLAYAGTVLTAAGLTLGTVTYVADYTCATIGLVRSQDPPPGTVVPGGTAVSVVLGKAPRRLLSALNLPVRQRPGPSTGTHLPDRSTARAGRPF